MVQEARRLIEHLRKSRSGWAFTGAGVSTPSGIPDFRGPEGLWKKYDPERVSTVEAFRKRPEEFFAFWMQRFEIMGRARPNTVHRLLARLEERGMLRGVITQNIDGLHRKAGSRTVLEIHGNAWTGTCVGCGRKYELLWMVERVRKDGTPLCDCGELVKPDVVLFGEQLTEDFQRAWEEVSQCDLLWVLGSSLQVWPAAELVPLAASRGATVIIANRDPTPYDDIATLVIRGDLVELATAVAQALGLEVG
ncbi:SIR2 family NAD-dependent protein deacylase [Candidatus Bipolaricaulota sp. J31]